MCAPLRAQWTHREKKEHQHTIYEREKTFSALSLCFWWVLSDRFRSIRHFIASNTQINRQKFSLALFLAYTHTHTNDDKSNLCCHWFCCSSIEPPVRLLPRFHRGDRVRAQCSVLLLDLMSSWLARTHKTLIISSSSSSLCSRYAKQRRKFVFTMMSHANDCTQMDRMRARHSIWSLKTRRHFSFACLSVCLRPAISGRVTQRAPDQHIRSNNLIITSGAAAAASAWVDNWIISLLL